MRSSIRTSSRPTQDGIVSMTDVLIAAKLVARRARRTAAKFPALRRVGVAMKDGVKPMEQYEDEMKSVRASLSE